MPYKVVNLTGGNACIGSIYIGRSKGQFHFGNPFSHKFSSPATVRVGSREQAIESFRKWIKGEAFHDVDQERREWILKNLDKLRGRDLACYCAPLPCHGDVYLELLEQTK